MADNSSLLFLFHKVDTCFFTLCFGKLTNMSRLSSNEKRWNLWPRQTPPWPGESFIGHDAPPANVWGFTRGDGKKRLFLDPPQHLQNKGQQCCEISLSL